MAKVVIEVAVQLPAVEGESYPRTEIIYKQSIVVPEDRDQVREFVKKITEVVNE